MLHTEMNDCINIPLQSSATIKISEISRDIKNKNIQDYASSKGQSKQSPKRQSNLEEYFMIQGRDENSELRHFDNNAAEKIKLHHQRMESEERLNRMQKERFLIQFDKRYSYPQANYKESAELRGCSENRRKIQESKSEERVNKMYSDRALTLSQERHLVASSMICNRHSSEMSDSKCESNSARGNKRSESERHFSVNGMPADCNRHSVISCNATECHPNLKRPQSLNNNLYEKRKYSYSNQKINTNVNNKFVYNSPSSSNENNVIYNQFDVNERSNESVVSKQLPTISPDETTTKNGYDSLHKLADESNLHANDRDKGHHHKKDKKHSKPSNCQYEVSVPSGNTLNENKHISLVNKAKNSMSRKSDSVLVQNRMKETSRGKDRKRKRKSTEYLGKSFISEATVVNERKCYSDSHKRDEKLKTKYKCESSKTESNTKNVNSCNNLKNSNAKSEKFRRLQNNSGVKCSSDAESEDEFEKFCKQAREKIKLKYEQNINKPRINMKEFIDDKTDDSSSVFYYNLLSSDVKKDVKNTFSCKEELKCPKNIFKVLFLKTENDDSFKAEEKEAIKNEPDTTDNVATNLETSEKQNYINSSVTPDHCNNNLETEWNTMQVKIKDEIEEAANEEKPDYTSYHIDLSGTIEGSADEEEQDKDRKDEEEQDKSYHMDLSGTIESEALNDNNDLHCNDSLTLMESCSIISDHLQKISSFDDIDQKETERKIVEADLKDVADKSESGDNVEVQNNKTPDKPNSICSCSSSEDLNFEKWGENSVEEILISDDDSLIEVIDLEDPKYDIYNDPSNCYENTEPRKCSCSVSHKDSNTEICAITFKIYQPQNVASVSEVSRELHKIIPRLHEVTSLQHGIAPQLHSMTSNLHEAALQLQEPNKQENNYYSHDLPPLNFVTSLSYPLPRGICHPLAQFYKNNFEEQKNRLCIELFNLFNQNVFENIFPADTVIEWTARLRTTAGYCLREEITHVTGKITRKAQIKLSSKVITTTARLRDTLLHEMCHAAAWIVDGYEGHHGSFWKAWANKAMSIFPEIPAIENRHDYKID